MKKIKYLVLLGALLLITNNVKAATITKATYDNAFKIEGTGTGQVAIAIFDLNNDPVYLTTTSASGGTFSITLPQINGLSNGNYKVKVADYNGTNTDDEVVDVKLTSNPKTGDNIIISFVICLVSIMGLIGIVFYFKKKKLN